MSQVLQTFDLSKQFSRTMVLDQVNLSVDEGSVYALLGPNGAGKSTMLQILMNLRQPTAGRAEVFGRDSRYIKAEDFTEIGYVAESQEMPDWMTVEHFMAYLAPFYPRWNSKLADELLDGFDLPRQHKLKHLSRGMRMKTLLASSLAYRPRLLVMDEPFSALDSLTRDELIEGLLANAEGMSILIASHDLSEIESFASHIGYLERGRLQFSEEMTELTDRFREIEITGHHNAYIPRRTWPATWLHTEESASLVRFVETKFEEERTMNEIKHLFRTSSHVSVNAMPLRSIFIALAKANRKAA